MNPSSATHDSTPAGAGARPCEYRVPIQAPLGECRSCHAPILWATSRSGKAIPLSVATIRTDETGQRWALTHFADCPNAMQHRRQATPPDSVCPAAAVHIELMDLPAYMAAHRLIVTHSTITDNGNGVLTVELFTRQIT